MTHEESKSLVPGEVLIYRGFVHVKKDTYERTVTYVGECPRAKGSVIVKGKTPLGEVEMVKHVRTLRRKE